MRSALNSRALLACILAAAFSLPPRESKSDEPATLAIDSMLGNEAGQVRDDNSVKMQFVWCPPGALTMEQVEFIDGPVTKDAASEIDSTSQTQIIRKVTPVRGFVTRGYWVGKYEVTQAQWAKVMATQPWKGRDFTREGDDFPATFVGWDDAMTFCHRLTERERAAGRMADTWEYTLPTEGQWERACRARTDTKFSFGDDEVMLREYGWFHANAKDAGDAYAHRVGQKKPNPWGIYDMHGNLWEWCRDVYAQKLPGGRDPEVTKGQLEHVIRGGCWAHAASTCPSSHRGRGRPDTRNSNLGFRVCATATRHIDLPKPGAGVDE